MQASLTPRLNHREQMTGESHNHETERLASSPLLGALAATTGMVGRIDDTDDQKSKEAAFDELMKGKWEAIRAHQLKPGDEMRDAAGGTVEIKKVYPTTPDSVYVTSRERLGMHIPRNALVLIAPNVPSSPTEQPDPTKYYE